MKKLLGTGAMLLLIIYLLPVCCRIYTGTALGDKAKDALAAYAETEQGNGTGSGSGSPSAAGGQAQSSGNSYAAADSQGVQGSSSVWSVGGSGTSTDTGAAPEGRQVLQDEEITVLVNGEPQAMPLETYVEGVVAAEISPDFPKEAIRAQAVAARTYAVYKINAGRPMQHREADVCDDYTHCAAYLDLAAAASARWGEQAGEKLQKIQEAVRDTAGEIVTKDGAAIVAVFHAASAARTESAEAVWGSEIPYLQSVVSPGGSACDKFEGTVRLSHEEFRKKVMENYPAADLSGDPKRWFSASTRSEAGSVIVCTLGDVQVKGTDLRNIFGLNSANFTLTITDDSISFHTIGYGHGVGLSQYGAKYFAGQGSSYKEILSHYYPGTEITTLAG